MTLEILALNLLKPIATLASGLGKQKKLFILIYHRVLDEPDFMRPGEVDKAKFDWQMALLATYFNVLPLTEALEKLKNNALPARAVSITFDDGYADNYLNALPVLQKYQLSATFFIASGFINGGRMWNDTVIEAVRRLPDKILKLEQIGLANYPLETPLQRSQAAQEIIRSIKYLPPKVRQEKADYIGEMANNMPNDLMMTTDLLQKLYQAGMEIGGHTVTHPILAKIDDAQALKEIMDNKQVLENWLSKKINFFAYPNGKPNDDYQSNHNDLVKSLGYIAAFSTESRVAEINSDYYNLPRFTPWDNSPVKFMLRAVCFCLKQRLSA